MSEIKYELSLKKLSKRRMSLDEAINSNMTTEQFEAYLDLHEIQNTRRDD